MADKQIIDAMWDDSPVDVSTEVNIGVQGVQTR